MTNESKIERIDGEHFYAERSTSGWAVRRNDGAFVDECGTYRAARRTITFYDGLARHFIALGIQQGVEGECVRMIDELECYGWHCPICHEPTGMYGHDCPATPETEPKGRGK